MSPTEDPPWSSAVGGQCPSLPPGAKAPMVWYGGENIAASGGKLNGMVSFTEIADRFEVEGVAKQDKAGLLMTPAVKGSFDALKQSIKGK